MARPRKRLPPGSRDILLGMAESGALYESRAASALGMSLRAFRRLLKDSQDAAEVWDEAMAFERDALLERLHRRVQEGDARAAQYLLAARHGVTDRPEGDSKQAQQPSVHIHLPSAMTPDQYARAIEATPGNRLEDGSGDGG